MKKIKIIVSVLAMVVSFPILGKESEAHEPVKTLSLGNFALPPSQQPGPLIAFGQNILDKGNIQVFSFIDYLKGVCKNFTTITPTAVYAVADNGSIFLALPIAAEFNAGYQTSHGIGDLMIQGEYAFFNSNTLTTASMITAVANITFPTGSVNVEPATGFGAASVFLGLTGSHVSTAWYFFTSFGAMFPTPHKDTLLGKQFLYQFGLNRNFAYAPDQWIFSGLLELDGFYKERDKVDCVIDQDSGGNQVLLTPSFWFSTKRFFLQAGFSWVVAQHLFGTQDKDNYHVICNLGWTFN